MSDEQMPAWAAAMEHRLVHEISQAIAMSEARLSQRIMRIVLARDDKGRDANAPA